MCPLSDSEPACDEIANRKERPPTSHPIHRVRRVEGVAPYRPRVEFEDHLERTIDLEPVLAGELYGPLRDPELFRQVRIDPEVCN